MVTWESIVAFALTLPEVVESTSWNTPSLKVRKKLLCRLRTEADGALAIKCSATEKEALAGNDDRAFYTIAHYDGWNFILVDLAVVDEQQLRELITEAWRICAPVRLREEFDA